jgi:cytochrome P450
MSAELKYDLSSPAFFRNADATFARMRREDPVYQHGTMYNRPVWYVTRYEEVDAVLRDSQRFALDFRLAFDPETLAQFPNEPQLMDMVNNHLLTKEGEDHRRLRALVSKAFTPRRIAELRPRIQAIASELLDNVQDRQEMDLVEDYAFPLPITVIAELLGIPVEDRAKFREWSDGFVNAAATENFEEDFYASAMGFVGYLGQVFEERRANPQDDLISALIQAEEEGDRLSVEELFSMVVLLIIAGHETTVSLIGNSVVALLANPEVLEHLRQNPDRMPQAVEELLRYTSPVQRSITRWVTEDVEIGGQQLRRGDMVIAVLGSANRDGSTFENPDLLDIERDNRQHVAFGRGAHYCLGAPLARLEAEIALNTLLARLPGLRLGMAQNDLPPRETALFSAYARIPIQWG